MLKQILVQKYLSRTHIHMPMYVQHKSLYYDLFYFIFTLIFYLLIIFFFILVIYRKHAHN